MPITGSQKALMFCQSGNTASGPFASERCGATRTGYCSGRPAISVNGTESAFGKSDASRHILIESLQIVDELNDAPNTCRFVAYGFTPTKGQPVIIRLGSTNQSDRTFAGNILHVRQLQESANAPANTIFYDVSAIDYTWRANKLKVTAQYTNQSATAILQSLVSTYASGFTSTHVASGLQTIDEITFTEEDLNTAISRVLERIGGYWYWDYVKDLHAWTGVESGVTNPTDLTTTHRSMRELEYDTDLSQVITRQYVEGRGSRLLSGVLAADTKVPLEAIDMFEVASDVSAKVAFQGSEGGAQHLTFSGVITGGGGSVVGPGLNPSSAPALAAAFNATGIEAGAHGYKYTWVTGAGETLPSPAASVTLATVSDPSSAPVEQTTPDSYFGLNVAGGSYKLKYVYARDTSAAVATLPSAASGIATANAHGSCSFSIPYSTDPSVLFIVVYLTTNGGSTYYLEGATANNSAGGSFLFYTGSYNDTDLATHANPPGSNNFSLKKVNLSSIAVGPSGVTSRKVYRTVAGGSSYLLLTTIADNTTTTYADTTADASLGAAAPGTDTSGLAQPDGQVNAGSTSLAVAGVGAFESGGGWAIIGNGQQVIRYTGVGSASLTGIPASGIGAILASISYNSSVTAAPMLTGIPASGAGSISADLTAGDEIYVVVTRNAIAAQTALAGFIGDGDDGIREEWVQDRRLSVTEARLRGDAILALRADPLTSLKYVCRDTNARSGRTVTINIGAPTSLSASFKIQRVTIDGFSATPTVMPRRTVEASSTRFSFEDLLRQRRGAAA